MNSLKKKSNSESKTFNIDAAWEPDTKEPYLSTYKNSMMPLMFPFNTDLFEYFNRTLDTSIFNEIDKKYHGFKSLPINEYTNSESKNYVLEIAAAGFNKDCISVSITGDILNIEINDENKEYNNSKKHINNKISYRRFRINRYIPDSYDLSKIDCSFKDGLLKIIIPVSEKPESKTKKIEIK